MRVLVTGGSGFIGSHVVDKLTEHGVTPRIFDLVHSPYHSAGEVETFAGSLMDMEALRLAMTGCHVVIHLAAVADVKDVFEEPSYAENINTRGTLNVLEAARRSKVRRFVYGSTTWVYSDCAETVRDAVGSAEIVRTEARPGDFSGKEVSSERAESELGWVPTTPFSEGVRRYLDWYREREELSWGGVDPALLV